MKKANITIGGLIMKKCLLSLILVALLGTSGVVASAPIKKDDKPIVVDKVCYAEEIIEYESDDNIIKVDNEDETTNTEKENVDECEDCATICVMGKATSSVSPDSATICGVIEVLDTDISISKENNFSAFDKVVSALKESGLNEEQISLEYFSCCPSYDYSSGRTLQGYMTSTTFTVKVDNIENLKTYIDVMTENGTTGICNIQYQLSTMEEEYSNALASAYENAKSKANKLLGQDNLKLVSIKEEMVFASNNLCRSYVEGVSAGLMGKIQIEARVFAEFEAIEGSSQV